jgi:hypothetical protein
MGKAGKMPFKDVCRHLKMFLLNSFCASLNIMVNNFYFYFLFFIFYFYFYFLRIFKKDKKRNFTPFALCHFHIHITLPLAYIVETKQVELEPQLVMNKPSQIYIQPYKQLRILTKLSS